jgi:hypothetical protein
VLVSPSRAETLFKIMAAQPSTSDLKEFFWFGASSWKSKSRTQIWGRVCSMVFSAIVPLTRNCSEVGWATP